MVDLYKRIENLCRKNGITVTEMCRQSGAARGSLTDLKMGRIEGLSIETLSKIAKLFGVSVDFVLGETVESSLFDLNARIDEINKWLEKETDGDKIKHLYDELSGLYERRSDIELSVKMGVAETKKAPSEDGEMDSFAYAAHGYSGRLTDADKATILGMMEFLAAKNEGKDWNGQTDGSIPRSE